MTNPRASTTSGLLFLVLLLAAKIAAMTTCADITFDSCGENEKGDWARGDWQPSLSQFDAKRQCIAYNKYVKPWRTSMSLTSPSLSPPAPFTNIVNVKKSSWTTAN